MVLRNLYSKANSRAHPKVKHRERESNSERYENKRAQLEAVVQRAKRAQVLPITHKTMPQAEVVRLVTDRTAAETRYRRNKRTQRSHSMLKQILMHYNYFFKIMPNMELTLY